MDDIGTQGSHGQQSGDRSQDYEKYCGGMPHSGWYRTGMPVTACEYNRLTFKGVTPMKLLEPPLFFAEGKDRSPSSFCLSLAEAIPKQTSLNWA